MKMYIFKIRNFAPLRKPEDQAELSSERALQLAKQFSLEYDLPCRFFPLGEEENAIVIHPPQKNK